MRPIKPPRLITRKARAGRRAMQYIVYRDIEYPTHATATENAKAAKAYADFCEQLERSPEIAFGNGLADPTRVKVQPCLDLYKAHLDRRYDALARTDKAAANSRKASLKGECAALGKHFGHMTVAALTISTVEGYVEWRCKQISPRTKKPISATTAKRELGTLSASLNYCVADKKLAGGAIKIKLPDDHVRRERYLTKEEVIRLLLGALGWDWKTGKRDRRHINYYIARFILIAYYTGSRRGVITKLGFLPSTAGGWFDIKNKLIYRAAQASRKTKKRKPTVSIPAKLLRHLPRWQRLSTQFAVELNGKSVRDLGAAFERAVVLAGLDPREVTPHIMRHTTITLKLLAGASIEAVADFVGASPAIIYKNYSHFAKTEGERIANLGFESSRKAA